MVGLLTRAHTFGWVEKSVKVADRRLHSTFHVDILHNNINRLMDIWTFHPYARVMTLVSELAAAKEHAQRIEANCRACKRVRRGDGWPLTMLCSWLQAGSKGSAFTFCPSFPLRHEDYDSGIAQV